MSRDTSAGRPFAAQEGYLCGLGTYTGTRFIPMGEVVLHSLHEAVEWIAAPLRTVADRLTSRGHPEAREWLEDYAGPRRMTDRLLHGETYVLILSSEDQPVQWAVRPVLSLPLRGGACLPGRLGRAVADGTPLGRSTVPWSGGGGQT